MYSTLNCKGNGLWFLHLHCDLHKLFNDSLYNKITIATHGAKRTGLINEEVISMRLYSTLYQSSGSTLDMIIIIKWSVINKIAII